MSPHLFEWRVAWPKSNEHLLAIFESMMGQLQQLPIDDVCLFD